MVENNNANNSTTMIHFQEEEMATKRASEELLFGLDFSEIDWSSIPVEEKEEYDSSQEQQLMLAEQQRNKKMLLRNRLKKLLQLKHPSQEPTLSSLYSATSNNSKDEYIRQLFHWVTETKGAVLDGIRPGKDNFGGRGLFATRTVAVKGTVLAVLPRSLRIGQKMACQRFSGLPSNAPDLTATSLLVLSFLAEAVNNPDSSNKGWGLYALSMPMQSSEFQNAIFMSQNEEESWAQYDKSYQKEIQNVRALAECCVQYIQNVLLSEDSNDRNGNINVNDVSKDITVESSSAIYWAIAMVMSRTHGFGSHTGGRWLTPILDLANHSPNANCELEGDDQGRLLLRANRPIQGGEEITIDYQVYDDAKLVATYGFSLQRSREQQ